MQKRLVIAGWSLLAVGLGASFAPAAPPNPPKPLAQVGTPGAATAGPKKPDAKQIAMIVDQGMNALAASDFKLARDTFLDAVQADPKNAKALHGLALAYFHLNELPKATATIDKAVMIPGALDHPMAMNASTIHLTAKAPMRAAKIARDYLNAKPNPVNEPLANVLAISLERADAMARKNAFYTDTKNFYTGYVKKMEAANPGYMRWGVQWLPADTVKEYNRANAMHQPVVDKTTREVADIDNQLTAQRQTLANMMQRIEKGYLLPEAAWPVQDEIRQLEDRRLESKRVLDEATAKLVKPAELPEFKEVVAMDAAIPPLSKPIAPPAAVAVNDRQPRESSGSSGSGNRPRRLRPPPGQDGPAGNVGGNTGNTGGNTGGNDVGRGGGEPAGGGSTPVQPPVQKTPEPQPPVNEPPPAEPEPPAPAPKKIVRLTTYAAAFAVSSDLVVTSARAVDGAKDISFQSRDGNSATGEVVRVDEASGLALVRVKGMRLAFLDLADPQAGKVTCAAFAEPNIFAPQAELLPGMAPAPAASWPIKFSRHPRLAGAPLIQNGKVVGVAVGDRDSEMATFPCVPVDVVRTLIGSDAGKATSSNPDPLYAVLQLSATKEREQ